MQASFTIRIPANANLLFTKEMAYCLPESMWHKLTTGEFEDFIHTILIRDPEQAIYSNYKAILKDRIGDATLYRSEVGFVELHKLYNFIKTKKGTSPVVINAIDLQTHPDETMKSYCEAVGIQFDPNMTTWERETQRTGTNSGLQRGTLLLISPLVLLRRNQKIRNHCFCMNYHKTS